MKNAEFFPRFTFSFFVCAIMAFTTTYFPMALWNSNFNVSYWNFNPTLFFGVTFLIGLVASVLYSLDQTDEENICIGDISTSYNLRTLYALISFVLFSVIAFLIIYFPFAISCVSFNPKNWKTSHPHSTYWAGILLLISLCFAVGSSWEYASKSFRK